MKTLSIANGGLKASEIALGCMRMADLADADAVKLVNAALEAGINFFDHADIYGGGRSEEVFARAFGQLGVARGRVYLQSKCGIREGMYDFSKEHIFEAVDGSLRRLKTDYLDCLLLHRPDTLMEPEEVAEAFDTLRSAGKVRYFGVSNFNPMQIELLRQALRDDLVVDQLQFGPAHTGLIDAGLNVNMTNPPSAARDGGALEYCRLRHITIQAWSPFQYGFFEGVFIGSPKYPELNRELEKIADEKGVSPSAVAVAWVLRHPAKIQTIVGTTKAQRLTELCRASEVSLTRAQWYAIYRAAGNRLP